MNSNQFDYIWFNGNCIKTADANINILTHSLHYAGAVFEGERAYNGIVFKAKEHTERLLASAKAVGILVQYSFDDIMEARDIVLKRNNICDAYVRPLIWRGSESINIINKNLSANLMIAAVQMRTRSTDQVNLHVSKWHKPNPSALPPQVKSSGHYEMMIVAQNEARAAGYEDAILLDHNEYIAECTTTNIFFVYKDQLVTPIADVFLNGITRQTVINLAVKLGIEVFEKRITLNDITKYDECFLTGTAAEVANVASVSWQDNKHIFHANKITKLLQTEYAALVRT